MRITFLGTNGWYNTETGNTSCIFIEMDRCYLVCDAGDGIYKLDQFVKDERPIHLLLTHLHLDHISGFHTFNKFRFRQGIRVFGPAGVGRDMAGLLRGPFSVDAHKLPFKLEFFDLEPGRHAHEAYTVEAQTLQHPVPTQGYRIECKDTAVSYCADTGPCENISLLSRKAGVMITECALSAEPTDGSTAVHLDARSAAGFAVKAQAGKLVLTHFNPVVFPEFSDRDTAQAEAQELFAHTVAAKDGLTIEL